MTTTVVTAIAAFFEKNSGENHEAVFKIKINAFDKFFLFFIFLRFCFHTKLKTLCCLLRPKLANQLR